MKTFAFVRSRTYYREFDYRLLTPISVLPTNIHQNFSNSVRNLLSDSVTAWDIPTWLLIKQDRFLLWGVAINNSVFSVDCDKEEVGRRGVRCFCGVVITDYSPLSIRLPYDIQAFTPVFNETVGKMWKERIQEQPDTSVELGRSNVYVEPTQFDGTLNTNSHICRIFPSKIDSIELLSACLACESDISIAINVTDKDQICNTTSALPIFNAVMKGGHSFYDIPIKQKCRKCGKLVEETIDGLCEDCQPKEIPINDILNNTAHYVYL